MRLGTTSAHMCPCACYPTIVTKSQWLTVTTRFPSCRNCAWKGGIDGRQPQYYSGFVPAASLYSSTPTKSAVRTSVLTDAEVKQVATLIGDQIWAKLAPKLPSPTGTQDKTAGPSPTMASNKTVGPSPAIASNKTTGPSPAILPNKTAVAAPPR
jgi:hypothetical protein